jgi:hypothetical protein
VVSKNTDTLPGCLQWPELEQEVMTRWTNHARDPGSQIPDRRDAQVQQEDLQGDWEIDTQGSQAGPSSRVPTANDPKMH